MSWKRRTVASSSDCNFLGGVTTKAKAESTSAIKREKDKANEAQRTRRESRAEEKVFLANRSLWRGEGFVVMLLPLLLLLQLPLFRVRELWWRKERIGGLGIG